MRRVQALVFVIACLSFAPLALAQEAMPAPPAPPQDPLLDARVGNWVGTGTMMGMPMTDAVHMDWILGHHFFRSTSTTTMTMPDGSTMAFDMEMTMKPDGAGGSTGTYMDAWGMQGQFTTRTENGAMITEWANPMDGTNNRAVETTNPDGGWTMVFHMQDPSGNWVESGQVVYTRAP